MAPNTLSAVERQILINQFKLLNFGYKNNQFDSIITILEDGLIYYYNEVFFSLEKEIDPKISKLVINVFEMYRHIQHYMDANPQDTVVTGSTKNKFIGFDANNEQEYQTCSHFVLQVKKLFLESKHQNSHCPMVTFYEQKVKLHENMKYPLSQQDAHLLVK